MSQMLIYQALNVRNYRTFPIVQTLSAQLSWKYDYIKSVGTFANSDGGEIPTDVTHKHEQSPYLRQGLFAPYIPFSLHAYAGENRFCGFWLRKVRY